MNNILQKDKKIKEEQKKVQDKISSMEKEIEEIKKSFWEYEKKCKQDVRKLKEDIKKLQEKKYELRDDINKDKNWYLREYIMDNWEEFVKKALEVDIFSRHWYLRKKYKELKDRFNKYFRLTKEELNIIKALVDELGIDQWELTWGVKYPEDDSPLDLSCVDVSRVSFYFTYERDSEKERKIRDCVKKIHRISTVGGYTKTGSEELKIFFSRRELSGVNNFVEYIEKYY